MNVLIFIADCLRPDLLGCYENKKVNTPTIDNIAEESIVFNNAISAAPWTVPSFYSIISGQYAHKHGIYSWAQKIPKNFTSIFKIFSQHNYRVGSFIFDPENLVPYLPEANVQGKTHDVDSINKWIRENAKSDFFLLIHSYSTHIPYQYYESKKDWEEAKSEFLKNIQSGERRLINQCKNEYINAINKMSEVELSSIVQTLKDVDEWGKTCFIFMSDHGESWGDDYEDRSVITGLWHLHGNFLYDSTIKIPLILKIPNYNKKKCNSLVRSVDIVPTILDYFAFDENYHTDGKSLLEIIKDENSENDEAIISTSDRGQVHRIAIRCNTFKMIYSLKSDEYEFYNLLKDPAETKNIFSGSSDIEQNLCRKIDIIRQDLETSNKNYDDTDYQVIEKRLKDLGYL